METQSELLNLEWPEALMEHAVMAEERSKNNNKVIYKGLRVRMGMHVGCPQKTKDAMTRRVIYTGPDAIMAANIAASAHGGQVYCFCSYYYYYSYAAALFSL